jgi:RNA-directed DNA polymerase
MAQSASATGGWNPLIPRDRGTPQGGVASPLLANLFLHYAFDHWMQRTYPEVPFERYADDGVVHCRTEAEAQEMVEAIRQRLADCGLELHPEKTKIVYCQDGQRKLDYPTVTYDFLGYSFRPRQSKSRRGNLFLNFSPAISAKAAKSIRHTIRSWKIHRWTQLSVEDLAASFNPVLRGWINYYGKYYRSMLAPILGQLDYALHRWARRKYKRLKGSQTKARAWVRRIAQQHPSLFVHWAITCPGMAER